MYISTNPDAESSTTVSSDGISYFIHKLSNNSINLIDTSRMSIISTFDNILVQPSVVCRSLGAIYLEHYDHMVALFESSNKFYLAAKKSVKGLRYCFELMPMGGYQRQTFYPACLSKTIKDDFIVIGGSDSRVQRMGNAVLTIYKIDENLQSIDSLILQGEDKKKLMIVNCVNRLAGNNIFVAGTFESIFVVEWNGISLSMISYYSMKHTCRMLLTVGLVTQISCTRDSFYSVCANDKYVFCDKII